MMYYPTDVVSELVATLPKNTKSKFINLCVELVLSDPELLNDVKNSLFSFPSPSAVVSQVNKPTEVNVELNIKDEIEPNYSGTNAGKVSREKIKFGM